MRAIYFLIAIAIVTIFFIVELFNPFLKAIFVALLLTISTSTLTIYFEKKLKSRMLSSILITVGLASLFFIPILYCIFSLVKFLNQMDQQVLVQNLNDIKIFVETIANDFALAQEMITKLDVGKSVQEFLAFGAYLGKNSAKFMVDMVMILIFFFFFTMYSTSISKFARNLLPLKKDDSTILFSESSNVMTVVLYSILVTAVFEGFLFGIFVTFFGYDGLFLGVLYGFASLIPVVGGIIMWLPISLYEATSTGSYGNAVAIALYSIIVISIIADTFIKPAIIKYINKKVVKKPTNVNELLIFFSIVSGLSTFGFWGMIIGPALVTFFISIMLLVKKYSEDFEQEKEA